MKMKTDNKNKTKVSRANSGIKNRRELERKNTLSRVQEGLEYLRDTGEKINLSTLSKASGVTRPTLDMPHIKSYLMQQKEFNRSLLSPEEIEQEFFKKGFVRLKHEYERAISKILALTDEIKRLKQQIKIEKEKKEG